MLLSSCFLLGGVLVALCNQFLRIDRRLDLVIVRLQIGAVFLKELDFLQNFEHQNLLLQVSAVLSHGLCQQHILEVSALSVEDVLKKLTHLALIKAHPLHRLRALLNHRHNRL